MSKTLFIRVQTAFPLSEREARDLVKEWVEAWLDKAETDTRYGVIAVSAAARGLRAALETFEVSNSGDNGK